MQRFLITYDLHGGTEEEYGDLIKALKRQGAVQVQKSVWYLGDEEDEHDRKKLRLRFGKHMKKGDRIVVVRFDLFSGRNSITKISES